MQAATLKHYLLKLVRIARKQSDVPRRTSGDQRAARIHVAHRMRRWSLALVLLCAAVIGLLAAVGSGRVAAQSVCASQSTEPTSPLIRDCETLLGLKDTLDPDGVLNWAGNEALALWDGVTSNATSGVTELSLSTKGLTGTVPAALANLPALEVLNLNTNMLTGTIPSALGSLTNLEVLELQMNDLTGGVPSSLGNLAQLEFLLLSENRLTGGIPSQLANLSNLRYLDLADNQLTGGIPAALGGLPKVEALRLMNNRLSGSIPSGLADAGDLPELLHLFLGDNELSGSIPAALGNLPKVTHLRLAGNRLSGSIPPQLGSLTTLQVLWLQKNELTGSIPTQLGQLTSLQHLNLWNNKLSGSIPTELGSLSNLWTLSLSVNALTGNIPTQLGSLTQLRWLYLRDNDLDGSIPTQLGSLTNLRELSLSRNQLSGSIPTQLGQLAQLQYLWLSGNQLTGNIPTQLGSLGNLMELDLSCNMLSGSIPASLANITPLETLLLNGQTISQTIPTALANKAGLTINVSSYCFASAPQNVRVRPRDQELAVTWAAPADDGAPAGATGVAITAYNLSYRETGTSAWTDVANVWTETDGGDLAYTISGLNNGTQYDVGVQAVNDAGGGAWSTTVTGTPGDQPPPPPPPPPPPKSKSTSSSSSRAPSPPPVPTRSPIIGSTPAATAMELAGDLLVIQRHDQPGVEVEVAVGWISQDGQRIIAIGFVRDGDLGQTYTVVRREGDGQVVRRWIAPDSPLVYAVPWPSVNTQFTFPVGVILAIPLDDQYPWPNMLTRRFDGGDDRILAYDAALGQWRHVPDLATFQARGYYWCNVTAADAGFFDRITLGPPYPATTVPARPDYPACQT